MLTAALYTAYAASVVHALTHISAAQLVLLLHKPRNGRPSVRSMSPISGLGHARTWRISALVRARGWRNSMPKRESPLNQAGKRHRSTAPIFRLASGHMLGIQRTAKGFGQAHWATTNMVPPSRARLHRRSPQKCAMPSNWPDSARICSQTSLRRWRFAGPGGTG